MGSMADKKKKKPASIGTLFWIAFILLILILFFMKKNTITSVLDSTGATDILSGKTRAEKLTGPESDPEVPSLKPATDPSLTGEVGDASQKGDGSANATGPEQSATGQAATGSNAGNPENTGPEKNAAPVQATRPVAAQPAGKQTTAPVEQKGSPTKPAVQAVSSARKPANQKSIPEKAAQTRKSTLFLVKIDPDGKVIRREVVREIQQSDSPLSETLKALFAGPTEAEQKKGLRSLVPKGTRLLSATVKDGVAILNLSEEFQFNQFGIEGYLGQLAQIVYTATSYPTVTSVQFLIEGQRHEYLGAEGVWIGTPLSRDKF